MIAGRLTEEEQREARWSGDCATRIEKGKDACPNSPTLDEGCIQDTIGETVYPNGNYDENIIRNNIDRIQIFDTYILIFHTDGSQEKLE